jgi:hypothetical protein
MSDKKRTTVTTIETNEIWIIRRVVPEPSEVEALTPGEIVQQAPVSRLIEPNNDSETTSLLTCYEEN